MDSVWAVRTSPLIRPPGVGNGDPLPGMRARFANVLPVGSSWLDCQPESQVLAYSRRQPQAERLHFGGASVVLVPGPMTMLNQLLR
jgi:hypothetical protein